MRDKLREIDPLATHIGPLTSIFDEKSGRSGWAVLAAGALVASIFAVVGANPAAAEPRKADGVAMWRACLGPAAESNSFADVADDDVHLESINCLAYYGITTGTSADTFDPLGNVTRSQMALFLARAADAAGIDLGEAMDMGFTDVNADDTERAAAINSLVSAGIMFGDTNSSFDPPSTTHFAPSDHVTRWEMARFLFAFLDLALDSVVIDQLPASVDNDGVGGIEVNDHDGDGSGENVDDFFSDARRQVPAHIDAEIGAIYELGVTTGTNGMVGEAGTFEPSGLVTRAQMASFIMRALNHTNLRPEGVTAQHTPDETMVSVRERNEDGKLVPVEGASVEVFYTNFEDHAFDSSGECVSRFVEDYDPSFDPCEIDRGDEETNSLGNHTFPYGSQLSNRLSINCAQGGTHVLSVDLPSSIATFVAWAWTGGIYDEVDEDTDLFRVEAANPVTRGSEPTHAIVSGGPERLMPGDDGFEHIKMGERLLYTVQLVDDMGKPAAPSAGEYYGFSVTIVKHHQSVTTANVPDGTFPFAFAVPREQTRLPGVFHPDSDGRFQVPVTNPDPLRVGPTRDNADVQVQIIVSALPGNGIRLGPGPTGAAPGMGPNADATTGRPISAADAGNNLGMESGRHAVDAAPANTGDALRPERVVSKAVRFSDNDPNAAVVSITPEAALKVIPETTRNSVSVSVLDQYKEAFRPPTGGYSVNVKPATVTVADLVDVTENGVTTFTAPVDSGGGAIDESVVGQAVAIRSFGRGTYGYTYGSSIPDVETINVYADVMSLIAAGSDLVGTRSVPTVTTSAMVFWANLGGTVRQTVDRPVFIADASQRLIAVAEVTQTDGSTPITGRDLGQPIAYEYGDEDRFVVEGEVVSFEQFEAIITSSGVSLAGLNGNRVGSDGTLTGEDNANLQWDDYRRSGISRRPTTDATWRLDNLHCPSASS